MFVDFLFVTGGPFGVVAVLREIDVELVFSHCYVTKWSRTKWNEVIEGRMII